MYQINYQLIEREADRSFFDASRFFVFKFNSSGYDVIATLPSGAFQKNRFIEICDALKMTRESASAFWNKCVAHQIIVEFPRKAAS